MKGNFVYFFYDSNNTLLYIGKTTNLRGRMLQHFSLELLKIEPWREVINKDNIITLQCSNVCDLDLYETYFINKYKPKYNKDKVFNISPTFDLPHLEPTIYKFKLERTKGISFSKLSKEYLDLITTQSNLSRLLEIENTYPHIKEMVETLGTKRIRTLKYVKSEINKELYNVCSEVTDAVKEVLDLRLTRGDFYTSSQIKEVLVDIYKQFKISKNPKGTDITKYYAATPMSKRIGSKVFKGFIL